MARQPSRQQNVTGGLAGGRCVWRLASCSSPHRHPDADQPHCPPAMQRCARAVADADRIHAHAPPYPL